MSKHNTCKDQNPDKKHRALKKALRKLQARQNAYMEYSSGGHLCHKPGSMKIR